MSAIVITALEEIRTLDAIKAPKVFLAGGITECPDWQSKVIKEVTKQIRVNDEADLVLLNPRRPTPSLDPAEQIAWEYRYLEAAHLISFWFPKESVCPIALFEYGNYAFSSVFVVTGVEPGYPRAHDVVVQTALRRPDAMIHSTLDAVVDEIVNFWKMWYGFSGPAYA